MILTVSSKYELRAIVTVKDFRERESDYPLSWFFTEKINEMPSYLSWNNRDYITLLRGNKKIFIWELIEERQINVTSD